MVNLSAFKYSLTIVDLLFYCTYYLALHSSKLVMTILQGK